jgi:hypothetical protein
MEQEEFSAVVERVHQHLLDRAERAKDERDRDENPTTSSAHIEAVKDVFVLVHTLELIEHLSGEVAGLRNAIEEMGGTIVEEGESAPNTLPQMFVTKPGTYLN